MSTKPEDFMKNYGMIIPQGAFTVPEMVEDPRGAPIYKGCDAELCACTGRCKEIVGWSQDPEKLAAHRDYIKQYNERRNKCIDIDYGEIKQENGIRFWERKK